MFDIGMSEIGLIGVVALIVLGPEKLPRVARTAGNLLGRAQRYLAEVKAEVNRQIDLEELRNVKSSLETAAHDMKKTVTESVEELHDSFDEAWKEATSGLHGELSIGDGLQTPTLPSPAYPTKKRKRLPGNAVPQWYRRQARVRTQALSGAARMARYRVKR